MNRPLGKISECKGKKTADKRSLNSRMPQVLTGGSLLDCNTFSVNLLSVKIGNKI